MIEVLMLTPLQVACERQRGAQACPRAGIGFNLQVPTAQGDALTHPRQPAGVAVLEDVLGGEPLPLVFNL
jgi:hypothetical protein